MLARRIPLTNSLVHATHPLVLTLVAVAALACEEGTPTDTAREVPRALAPRAALGSDVALAQGDTTPPTTQAIPLPVNQVFNGGGVAFRINQTGTGPNGNFTISNASSAQTALQAQSNGSGVALRAVMSGTGRAAQFQNTSLTNNSPTLDVLQAGMGGPAGLFTVNNIDSPSSALSVTTNSTFTTVFALRVVNTGEGNGGYFESSGDNIGGNTLEVRNLATGAAAVFSTAPNNAGIRGTIESTSNFGGSAGIFRQLGGFGSAALDVETTCAICQAGRFVVNGAGNVKGAIEVSTNGEASSWAGIFTSTGAGGGVRITTNGGPGLQVLGGSKNAVVPTGDGSRALYTEESTEVWFTDYGFSRLANGQVRVRLDPKFSETVSLGDPYHVFVQPYGRAEIYVTNRNRAGFDVVLKDGEPNVEFSYRVVAKRLGFESKRLERAPWADRALVAKRSGRQQRVAMQ